MRPTPYIGITDFMEPSQVERMQVVFTQEFPRPSLRKLHVGTMTSRKFIDDLPTRWKNVFLPVDRIHSVFIGGSDVLMNVLHYADYEDGTNLYDILLKLVRYGGRYLNAIQLDMIWPDIKDLQNFHALYSDVDIILQVGQNALQIIENNPRVLVSRLKRYEGIVKYVLLDKSMGQGKGMDSIALMPFVRALYEHFPHLGVAVAGGLGPYTMHLVAPLVFEFPDISIDAQGQLRESGDAQHPINWNRAEIYIRNAGGLFLP